MFHVSFFIAIINNSEIYMYDVHVVQSCIFPTSTEDMCERDVLKFKITQ